MISAEEARRLIKSSETAVNQALEELDGKIRTAADQGKREHIVHLGSCEYSIPDQIIQENKRLIQRLMQLGYTAKIELYGTPYVPRGLDDGFGGGPPYTNYGLIIRW